MTQYLRELAAYMPYLKACSVIIFGVLGIYLLHRFLQKKISIKYPHALPVHVFVRIVAYLLYFLVACVALQEFGINMTAMIGAAGVLGVAVSFAAQTSVANIVSGFFLTFERPFDLNDIVQIDGIEGHIQALDLFAVTLKTGDSRSVRIPNEKVLKTNIINISRHKMRRFDVTIDFACEANLQVAFDAVRALVKASDYLQHEKEPYIVVSQITGSCTRVIIGVWTTQQKWQITRLQFLPQLKHLFDQQGIKLAVLTNCAHQN